MLFAATKAKFILPKMEKHQKLRTLCLLYIIWRECSDRSQKYNANIPKKCHVCLHINLHLLKESHVWKSVVWSNKYKVIFLNTSDFSCTIFLLCNCLMPRLSHLRKDCFCNRHRIAAHTRCQATFLTSAKFLTCCCFSVILILRIKK